MLDCSSRAGDCCEHGLHQHRLLGGTGPDSDSSIRHAKDQAFSGRIEEVLPTPRCAVEKPVADTTQALEVFRDGIEPRRDRLAWRTEALLPKAQDGCLRLDLSTFIHDGQVSIRFLHGTYSSKE